MKIIKFLFFLWLSIIGVSNNAFALQSLPYDNYVRTNSARFGLDPLAVHAQIQVESTHVNRGFNGVCCYGLMQLHGQYFKGNLQDPNNNINQGTAYMRQLLGQFNNNYINALRAYNWGPGNMHAYLKGNKRTMPRETVEYSQKIERWYISYGGKGRFFNGQVYKVNPNTKAANEQLESSRVCKPVKLPTQENVDINTVPNLPPIVMPPGVGERTVFDPTKSNQTAQNIQEIYEQIKVIRGQYDSLTKGMAGLGLLTNISQMAGYEMPTTINPTNENGGIIYQNLQAQRAADTGVYASPELKASKSKNAQISNHAFAEAEMGWTQIMCSLENVKAIQNTQTNTQKQSKDLGNRIAIERALLDASASKIRSSLVMLNAAQRNYQLDVQQAVHKYNK